MNAHYLGFTVGDFLLAFPAKTLLRVLPAAALQSVPASLPALIGVLNLEGAVIPVFSSHALLGLPLRTPEPEDHFLLLDYEGYDRPEKIRVLLHVENVLGLLGPESYTLTQQSVPLADETIQLCVLNSHWGLLPVVEQDELFRGLDIQLLQELVDKHFVR